MGSSLERFGKPSGAWRPDVELQAARLTDELRLLHWDNCKVDFELALAFAFAHEALWDGHDAAGILKVYDRALHECHAFATDRTASRGRVCRFKLSSTVSRARKYLARVGVATSQRIRM